MSAQTVRTLSPLAREQARTEARRRAILADILKDPSQSSVELARKHKVHHTTIYRLRAHAGLGATPSASPSESVSGSVDKSEDRSETWGRLLTKKIPLVLRARVLRDLVKSENPVAASRALEMVLESDGLRKKLPAPSSFTSIIVQSSDDVGMSDD